MEAVFRAAAMYLLLLLLFRCAGRRSFSEMTSFDFVVVILIGESTQQALITDDYSFVNAAVLVTTLVAMDVGLSLWKQRSERVQRVLESTPVVIVRDGRPLEETMQKERVDVHDVLRAARIQQGLERLDQIRYAVLESDGVISVIPRPSAAGASG